MTSTNQQFFDLLKSIVSNQTFPVKLTDGKVYDFKILTTAQYKELIKTVADSTLTKSLFPSIITKIMEENKPQTLSKAVSQLTTFDRLIFILESRINSISPNIKLASNEEEFDVDLNVIKEKIFTVIEQNKQILAGETTIVESDWEICLSVPSLEVDNKINTEIYDQLVIDKDDSKQLQSVLGDSFITEISKYIRSVKIKEATANLNEFDSKARTELVEALPASLIQKVIDFAEKVKDLSEECLTINNTLITIDSSLFSVR